ncbi:hypothetical protein BKA83DRAFT_19757 [Pisolithus microcarpus]|nr:hypothetical protein BKA83DRAFT_19757 [Pisolithus microcarpus]
MSKIERGTRRLKLQILLPLEHKVGLLRLRQLVCPFNLSSTRTIDHLLTPMLVTTQLVSQDSQQPRMPQDSAATERNSRLTSRFRPQPLSMVPEVPSTSSTPDPFMSRAVSTTVSGSSKGTTEKSYFKPSQTEHNDLSEPRSGEESHDSNDGLWSSLDDAGDVQDAEDEASCGRAGSNDVPDSDHMSENTGPHELDDELGQGGQTPSPQSIVSSQHAPSQQYVPRRAVSSQSGPAPAQRPVLQQSRLS